MGVVEGLGGGAELISQSTYLNNIFPKNVWNFAVYKDQANSLSNRVPKYIKV